MRVKILGIEGVHEVVSEALALSPPHRYLQVRLAPGSVYGRYRGGDLIGVEAWRCEEISPRPWQPPVDLEDFPCGPA